LRAWEHGAEAPLGIARPMLQAVDDSPEAVRRWLAVGSWQRPSSAERSPFRSPAEAETPRRERRVSTVALELMESFFLSHGLLIPDALIAATARENGLVLFTRNVRHYQMIGGLQARRPY